MNQQNQPTRSLESMEAFVYYVILAKLELETNALHQILV